MKIFTALSILFCFCQALSAQCDFDPKITGDTILCPNGTATLSAQMYDKYQWYKREYSETTLSPIIGDTSQTISINNPNDVLYFFAVEATLDNCTELSPQVLIDGWGFLPVTVASIGDFTTGNNGEAIVCIGDTMYFTLNLPYNTNITWYQNGNPIPGETSTKLIVTSPGLYTVTGAPDICPDYIQSLGLNIEVVFINCTTHSEEAYSTGDVLIYPNPANEHVFVKSEREDIINVIFYNNLGQILRAEDISGKQKNINISEFDEGIYFIAINKKTKTEIHKLIIN